MLIHNLLYSLIENNDNVTLFKVKEIFFQPKEQVYLEFLKDYFARYNKLPDVITVESKFNITLPPNTESTDYWYSEVLIKYQESIIENAVISSARNKDKALDYFQQAIIDYNVDTDAKIADYSDGKRRVGEYEARKGTGGVTYLSTGTSELDGFSLGYKRADLWTVGGYEGSGKSWYLLRMADWVDQYMLNNNINKTVLIVSGEMDTSELEERLDAIRCKMSYARLSKGELSSGEERIYKRYLNGFHSNIRIVDSFDSLKDVDYFMTLYRPAITFIDGSHLLSSSYDWTEIAKVTATMKRMTRNKKIPIINTTHLKADKGKSSKGGDIDDFAYTKGYTRDSDIVGVIFKSDMMDLENKFGIDWVKVRRGSRTQLEYKNEYNNSEMLLTDTRTGAQIGASKSSSSRSSDSDFEY